MNIKIMNFKKLTTLALATLILNLLCVAWVHASQVTIAVSKTPLSAPVIIAAENGFFEQEGLDVTLKTVIGGHRAMKALLGGEADIATSSDMVITNAIRNDKAVRVLATFVGSQKDSGVVIDQRAGIKSNADLKGKRIGVTLNTAAHYYIDTYLLLAGVPLDSVELINTAPENMSKSLNTRQVDAIASWEPWVSNSVEHGNGNTKIMRDVYAYTLTFNLVGLEKTVLNASQKIAILKALLKAEAYLRENPDKSMRLVSAFIDKDPVKVKKLWPNYDYQIHLRDSLRLTIESQIKWRDKLEKTQTAKAERLEEFFDSGPLLKLDNARVGLTF